MSIIVVTDLSVYFYCTKSEVLCSCYILFDAKDIYCISESLVNFRPIRKELVFFLQMLLKPLQR
jgi:hypothetical protein